jgi:hypothetical protein
MTKVDSNSQKKGKGGSKPGERRGGRKKGTPNKFSSDVRQMVLEALNGVGGVEYLQAQAAANPSAFMTLVGKVIPKEITGAGGDPLFQGVKFIGVEVE